MKLYICVTSDKYELPIAVAESKKELARMLGVTTNTVAESLSRVRQGSAKWSKYKEVEADDE